MSNGVHRNRPRRGGDLHAAGIDRAASLRAEDAERAGTSTPRSCTTARTTIASRTLSASVLTQRDFDDDRYLSLDLTVDTLTGASPSGAIATGRAADFHQSVGRRRVPDGGRRGTARRYVPRHALCRSTSGWTQPFARLYTLSAGLGFSTEYDYTHLGANLGVTRDFNQRNTTLSAAVAWAQDDIDPVGGAPLAARADAGRRRRLEQGGTDSKDVLDLLLGVTQVHWSARPCCASTTPTATRAAISPIRTRS